jgi:hypothetical protein
VCGFRCYYTDLERVCFAVADSSLLKADLGGAVSPLIFEVFFFI